MLSLCLVYIKDWLKKHTLPAIAAFVFFLGLYLFAKQIPYFYEVQQGQWEFYRDYHLKNHK